MPVGRHWHSWEQAKDSKRSSASNCLHLQWSVHTPFLHMGRTLLAYRTDSLSVRYVPALRKFRDVARVFVFSKPDTGRLAHRMAFRRRLFDCWYVVIFFLFFFFHFFPINLLSLWRVWHVWFAWSRILICLLSSPEFTAPSQRWLRVARNLYKTKFTGYPTRSCSSLWNGTEWYSFNSKYPSSKLWFFC